MIKNSKAYVTKKFIRTVDVIILTVFFITLCNQGGYYEGALVLCGLLICPVLFFCKCRVTDDKLALLVFSLWYLYCSLQKEFVIEYVIRGFIPFITFLFYLPVSKEEDKEGLKDFFLKLLLITAVISIVHCLLRSLSAGRLLRLTFPFQYSNACGIFFGTCFVLCVDIKGRIVKYCKIIFASSLILTQSVGALIITAAAFVIIKRSVKQLVITIASTLAFSVVFHKRLIQSLATFIERLLQMRDGFFCMLKNPLSGIGAGRWANAKNIYQTGFYGAKTIHSSIVQIGVNSGVIGLILFFVFICFFLKKAYNNKKIFICLCMLLAHAFFDFSFSFIALNMLGVMLNGEISEPCEKTNAAAPWKIISVVLLAVFIMFSAALSEIKAFENKVNSRCYAAESLISEYRESRFLKNSENAVTAYIFLLNGACKYEEINNIISGRKYPSDDMILLKISQSGEEEIKEYLKAQPFDLPLRRFAEKYGLVNDETAAGKMSRMGRILYKMKGENE